jgi:methyltransferase (TIGR00027 family)
MRADSSSLTAVIPALLRAAHQVFDERPLILDDPVAVGLVDRSTEPEIRASAELLQSSAMKRLRSTFVLRSRYAEDCLAEAAEHAGQYVILGAGLDTFAYRQPGWAKHLRIFEVDHPATQQWKQERLAKADVWVPPNLTFVPLDFERASLRRTLDEAKLDTSTPTVFSWLGVTQYLTDSAIDRTLEYVASFPRSSRIVITMAVPEEMLAPGAAKAAALNAAAAADRGEPWINRLAPRALSERLTHLGFASAFHLAPEEVERRYFAGRTDGLEVPVIEQILLGTV